MQPLIPESNINILYHALRNYNHSIMYPPLTRWCRISQGKNVGGCERHPHCIIFASIGHAVAKFVAGNGRAL
uniref:Uncharacterized protein n=1 Tax=Physcomitrium patens TaxID=3218 RepID=A0A2K1KCB9_PHYPA|nr:hypothetical protein PHYPA_010598 [Physcomitrium patens]